MKAFIRDHLFETPVDLESQNTLRNLSEILAVKTILETFKKAINALTVRDKGDAEIRDTLKLRDTRPFMVENQEYICPSKSLFKRIVWDSDLEKRFIVFLEKCDDVVSFAKNFFAVGFRLDYFNSIDGKISYYYPDFIVKLTTKDKPHIVIVETKGREDLDVPLKMERLRQWCEDMNAVQQDARYSFVYVDQDNFDKYSPKSFRDLMEMFREYQEAG